MLIRYSALLYLLITFIMFLQSIGEKNKRKILLMGMLFFIPAIGLTVFLCIRYTFHDILHGVVKYLIEIYITVTLLMTLNNIKAKRKIPALISGTLFLLPVILMLFLWYSSVSIL
jgi:hypothetical protein